MSSLLSLAQETIERAVNPAYGVVENELRAARLAAVINSEGQERFDFEVGQLDDPETFTSYGWAWVLEYAIGHGIALDRSLLAELCRRWDEPALIALVIEASLETDGSEDRRVSDAEWLDIIVAQAAPAESQDNAVFRDDRTDNDEIEPFDEVDITAAETLLTALLILGSDPAFAAARELLDRSWPGSSELTTFFNDRVEDPDALARRPWARLGESRRQG